MANMHNMLMPFWDPSNPDDPTKTDPNYPKGYEFSVNTANLYLSMPEFFQKTFTSFGTGDTSSPPENSAVPQLPSSFDSAQNQVGSFSNYAVVALKLNQAFTDLAASDKTLAPHAQAAATTSTQGQAALNAAIDSISTSAPTVPPSGTTEDDFIISYLDSALAKAKTAVDTATGNNNSTASQLDAQTKQIQALEAQIKQLQTQNAQLQKELDGGASGPSYDPSTLDPASTNTDDSGTGWSPTDLGADTSGDSSLGDSSLGDSSLGDTGSSLGGLGTGDTGDSGLASAVPASADTGSSGSDMGSLMSDILPMMMMQMQQRGQGDNLGEQGDGDRLQPGRYRDYPAAMSPPSTAPPATGPSAQSDQQSQSQSTTAPQGATGPIQPGGPAPRTPGADGLVTYTFPDGRTQKVSPTVAQALDAAFSNSAGTDAQAAYAKTPGQWTDNKQIGTRVDPSQLKTGDVATWDANKTAILVVWGAGDAASAGADPSAASGADGASGAGGDAAGSGSLEVIIDGKLVPFDENISGKSGGFGNFAGFAHPKNVDAGSTQSDPDTAAGMPMPGADPSTADPSAAAPAVTAPTS